MSKFLAQRDRTTDQFDSSKASSGKVRYIDPKSAHDFSAEVVSASMIESTNPKLKGTEFFVAKIKVLSVESGGYYPKGSKEIKPLEEGLEVSIVSEFNPAHTEWRQDNEFQDMCEFVAAATGELEDVYLTPDGGPTRLMEVLEDDGAAIQGAKIIVKSVQNGEYHNSTFHAA